MEKILETFEKVRRDCPNLCDRMGKKGKNGQTLYGDLMDFLRDQYELPIYDRNMTAYLIIGAYVTKNRIL